MIRYEDECVDCGMPCYDCRYRQKVKHLYCDECGEDCEELYEYEGQELCEECLLSQFNKIEL